MSAESRGAGALPDDVVDAFLDRTPGLDEPEVRAAVRGDLAADERLEDMQNTLDALRRPVRAPDFSASILAQVGLRRPWMPTRLRNWVSGGRLAAAACFLLVVAGAFIVERAAPDAVSLAERPAPLSSLVSAGQADVSSGLRSIAGAIGSVTQAEAEPPAMVGGRRHVRGQRSEWVVFRPERSTVYFFAESCESAKPDRLPSRLRCADMPQPAIVCAHVRRFRADQVMFLMKTPDDQPVVTVAGFAAR